MDNRRKHSIFYEKFDSNVDKIHLNLTVVVSEIVDNNEYRGCDGAGVSESGESGIPVVSQLGTVSIST